MLRECHEEDTFHRGCDGYGSGCLRTVVGRWTVRNATTRLELGFEFAVFKQRAAWLGHRQGKLRERPHDRTRLGRAGQERLLAQWHRDLGERSTALHEIDIDRRRSSDHRAAVG